MSEELPSTKGDGHLCITNERWGQHDAPPQFHAFISLHERLGYSEGCKQAPFYCSSVLVLRKRGVRGAGNTFYTLSPSWEHALALIRARYRQFWSFWHYLTPFSAFDGLVHVVNLDEAETLWRLMKLIRTDERGVTINQGRWPFVHERWG